MKHQITFDNTVTQWAGGVAETEAKGTTVQEALFDVAKSYPAFRLFNCEGELRSIVKVSRNDLPVALQDALVDGDILRLSVGA